MMINCVKFLHCFYTRLHCSRSLAICTIFACILVHIQSVPSYIRLNVVNAHGITMTTRSERKDDLNKEDKDATSANRIELDLLHESPSPRSHAFNSAPTLWLLFDQKTTFIKCNNQLHLYHALG